MAGSFVVHGDGTITVAFSYTAPADIVQATADAGAHRLYNTGRYVPVDGEGEASSLPSGEILSAFLQNGVEATPLCDE